MGNKREDFISDIIENFNNGNFSYIVDGIDTYGVAIFWADLLEYLLDCVGSYEERADAFESFANIVLKYFAVKYAE